MHEHQTGKAEDKESTFVQGSESLSAEQDHFYHDQKENCYHKIQGPKAWYETNNEHLIVYQQLRDSLLCGRNLQFCRRAASAVSKARARTGA